MKGVSAIVVIILILLITVSLAALAYTFFTGMMGVATEETAEAIEHTTSSMLGRVKIDSIKIQAGGDVVYIRNTGDITLTSFELYINENPDPNPTVNPTTLTPGSIGNITTSAGINIVSGDKVKVTSAEGAIATRTAQ